MAPCMPRVSDRPLGLPPTAAAACTEQGVSFASQGDDMDRLLPLLTVLTSTAGLIGAIWIAVSMLF